MGVAEVEVEPSPNNHSLATLPVDEFRKFTFSGVLQEVKGEAENPANGLSITVIDLFLVAWQPPKSLTSVTLYVPAAVYVFTGFIAVDVVPSPKSQVALKGVGN